MITFASRRRRGLALVAGLSLLAWFVYQVGDTSLRPMGFYTGWPLFALMLLLAGYNVYKKVPYLPLGSSSSWLQLHLHAGLFTVVLFLLHAGAHVPHGPLGKTLYVLYVGVAGSGLFGLFLSRRLGPRLATRGEEVIRERIPVFRKRIQIAAEALVVRSVAETDSTTIAEFYVRRLQRFFIKPRHFLFHVMHSTYKRHALLADMADQHRYLNAQERKIMDEIAELVQLKDDLDYHDALQSLLKHWLFVHIPLSYSLLVFTLMHILLVYAFSGVIG